MVIPPGLIGKDMAGQTSFGGSQPRILGSLAGRLPSSLSCVCFALMASVPGFPGFWPLTRYLLSRPVFPGSLWFSPPCVSLYGLLGSQPCLHRFPPGCLTPGSLPSPVWGSRASVHCHPRVSQGTALSPPAL